MAWLARHGGRALAGQLRAAPGTCSATARTGTAHHNRICMRRSSVFSEGGPARVIDLRSDTVTKPSVAMRDAMYDAPVGDDVYGEDPTVALLESSLAALMGKESAVFVPSGTMSNLLAVGVWCPRGSEAICGDRCHIFNYEAAGAAAVMGVQYHTVPTEGNGTLRLQDIEDAMRPDDQHYGPTALVAVENSHNMCGGVAIPGSYMDELGELCRGRGLPLHVDGARVFNAAVALGVPVSRLVAAADSVSVCLSKGLGCPVGSVLVGEAGFVDRARRMRKMLGGGMRQAGVVAAAGLVALGDCVDRMEQDHTHARLLWETLRSLPGLECPEPQTNIVLVKKREGSDAPCLEDLRLKMENRGVHMWFGYDGSALRAVVHRQITREDIEAAAMHFREAVAELLGSDNGHTEVPPAERGSFVLVVKLQFRPGGLGQFLPRWQTLAEHCRVHEPRTLTYTLSVSPTEKDTVMIYERYPTKQDLQQPHCTSAPFRQLNEWLETADIVIDKEVTEYYESNIGYHHR